MLKIMIRQKSMGTLQDSNPENFDSGYVTSSGGSIILAHTANWELVAIRMPVSTTQV